MRPRIRTEWRLDSKRNLEPLLFCPFFCDTDYWNPRALYYSPNSHVCHILWSLFKL